MNTLTIVPIIIIVIMIISFCVYRFLSNRRLRIMTAFSALINTLKCRTNSLEEIEKAYENFRRSTGREIRDFLYYCIEPKNASLIGMTRSECSNVIKESGDRKEAITLLRELRGSFCESHGAKVSEIISIIGKNNLSKIGTSEKELEDCILFHKRNSLARGILAVLNNHSVNVNCAVIHMNTLRELGGLGDEIGKDLDLIKLKRLANFSTEQNHTVATRRSV